MNAPRELAGGACPFTRPVPPLTSHKLSVGALMLLHPGLEVLDLNRPLASVPAWSWGDLKPSTAASLCSPERESMGLSRVEWDEEDE